MTTFIWQADSGGFFTARYLGGGVHKTETGESRAYKREYAVIISSPVPPSLAWKLCITRDKSIFHTEEHDSFDDAEVSASAAIQRSESLNRFVQE